MHISAYLLALASLVVESTAQANSVGSSTYTWSSCLTHYGKSSERKVPTRHAGNTRTFVSSVTSTFTPSVTHRPRRSTETTTSTTVETETDTAAQSTDTTTVYSTVTSTETDSTTTTISEEITQTDSITTTISGTTTVGTVSGFTPAASLPSVQQNGGSQPYNKRSLDDWSYDVMELEDRAIVSSNLTRAAVAVKYPHDVVCHKNVRIFTVTTIVKTAKHASTVTGETRKLRTKTSITTETTTTTVTPAKTTVTASSTSTETTTTTTTLSDTSTSTTTTTTTVTDEVPIATSYAACGQDNLVGTVGNSEVIDFRRPTSGSFVGVDGVDNPHDCCVACQTTSDCIGFGFSLDHYDYGCLIIENPGTCDATAQNWFFFNEDAEGQIVVGNGNCGQGTYLTHS